MVHRRVHNSQPDMLTSRGSAKMILIALLPQASRSRYLNTKVTPSSITHQSKLLLSMTATRANGAGLLFPGTAMHAWPAGGGGGGDLLRSVCHQEAAYMSCGMFPPAPCSAWPRLQSVARRSLGPAHVIRADHSGRPHLHLGSHL